MQQEKNLVEIWHPVHCKSGNFICQVVWL